MLGAGFFPWLTPLLVGFARLVRSWRRPEASTALYAAAGLVAGLVFFSLSAGKLPNYILPLAPLIAVIVAWELGQELRDPCREIGGPLLLCLTLGAWAIVLGLLGWGGLERGARLAARIGAGIYGAGMLVALPGVVARRPRWVWSTAAATAALFLLAGLWVLTPDLVRSRTAAYLVRSVPELQSSRPLVVVAVRVPSLTFYLDRVPEQILHGELQERLDRDDAPVFVLAHPDLHSLAPEILDRLREVGHDGKLVVLEERAGPPES